MKSRRKRGNNFKKNFSWQDIGYWYCVHLFRYMICGVWFNLRRNDFPMEGSFGFVVLFSFVFPFEIYLLGWLTFLQFLLKTQNSDFMFSQRNVFPEKLLSFCVEAVWKPYGKKKYLKTLMKKVVSGGVYELHFVNFCKVIWDLDTAIYLGFSLVTDVYLHNWNWFLCQAYAQTKRWLWWDCEWGQTWPEYGTNPAKMYYTCCLANKTKSNSSPEWHLSHRLESEDITFPSSFSVSDFGFCHFKNLKESALGVISLYPPYSILSMTRINITYAN